MISDYIAYQKTLVARSDKLRSELRTLGRRLSDGLAFTGDLYAGLSIRSAAVARHHSMSHLFGNDFRTDPDIQGLDEHLLAALQFPTMLADDDGYVRDPLEQVLERGQRRIDEAIGELTYVQRAYYLDATSYLQLAWDAALAKPGFCIILRHGKLTLEDAPSLDDEMRHLWGSAWKGAFPRPGTVRDFSEFSAYIRCAPGHVMCQRGSENLVWSLWDKLAPLLRDGRINQDDLNATDVVTWSMDHRDRANERLSFHRLINEEGWRDERTAELMEFAISLHQVAGDDGFDLADDLLNWGDAAAALLDRHWELCEHVADQATYVSCDAHPRKRVPEGLYEEGLRIGWDLWGCYLRGTAEERALAAIARDMLTALGSHDTPAALDALRAFCAKQDEFVKQGTCERQARRQRARMITSNERPCHDR